METGSVSGTSDQQTDLLEALVEAVRLTCAFDLHFCDRRDSTLSKTAEKLEDVVHSLRPAWPSSLPVEAKNQPLVATYQRDLLDTISELAREADLVASRISERDPHDRSADVSGVGARYQNALVELWRRLSSLCEEQVNVGTPHRKITSRPLQDALMMVRRSAPTNLLRGVGRVSFLQELRQPGEPTLDQDEYRRLSARIRRTWKLNVGRRSADGNVPEALARYAREEGLERSEAKQMLVEGALAAALQDLDRRATIRIGQQWRTCTLVPVRVRTDGSDIPGAADQWANYVAATAAPHTSSFWVEDLPSYRAWKHVVNTTISRAEDDLLSSYGKGEVNVLEDTETRSGSETFPGPTAEAFSVDGAAEVEARLAAASFVQHVERAGLTQRQAEVWLRTRDLPPGIRQQLANRLGVELPAYRQTRDEVADALGISPGTAGSHQNRAAKKIRKAFRQI